MANHRFSMVEMLLVLAIISTLASILLPSLKNANAQVRTTACANNQRMMLQACDLYSGNFYNWSPAWTGGWAGNSVWPINPAYKELLEVKGTYDFWQKELICPDAAFAFNTTRDYLGKTYYCIDSSYGMMAVWVVGTGYVTYKINKVVRPSTKLCVIDCLCWNAGGGESSYLWTYTDYVTGYGVTGEAAGGGAAYRHPGISANIGFFDGHVQTMPWQTLYATRATLCNPLK